MLLTPACHRTQGSPDTSLAEAALFSKHPQITGWNDINGYELKITGTFFIDMSAPRPSYPEWTSS